MSDRELSVTVSVPGKLFIAGEYAVTRPGGLALVAAVESDFSVNVKKSAALSKMRTNVGLPEISFCLKDLMKADILEILSEWTFALTALKRILSILGSIPDFELEIDIQSGLGFGESKKGYGSSAAVVCGIVKALNQFFKLELTLQEEFKIAFDVHYEVQRSGSGGDIAAIIFGGVVFYRNEDLIETVDLPCRETYVLSTGLPIKTGQKLAETELSDEFFADSNAIVEKLLRSKNFSDFKRELLNNQALLRENIPVGYVTEKLDFALKAVNSHPRLAGKISGSGFGENMIVFSNGASQSEMDLLAQTLEQHGMKLEVLKIAPRN
ncbi:mevalonate kinase [Lactovum odontotermitis]